MVEYFKFLEGTWVGGGFFFFEDESDFHENNNLRRPLGFRNYIDIPADMNENGTHKFYYEEIEFYLLKDINNEFGESLIYGVGFTRRDKVPILNSDGSIAKDISGKPVF